MTRHDSRGKVGGPEEPEREEREREHKEKTSTHFTRSVNRVLWLIRAKGLSSVPVTVAALMPMLKIRQYKKPIGRPTLYLHLVPCYCRPLYFHPPRVP
jgi:hypothetical protein